MTEKSESLEEAWLDISDMVMSDVGSLLKCIFFAGATTALSLVDCGHCDRLRDDLRRHYDMLRAAALAALDTHTDKRTS